MPHTRQFNESGIFSEKFEGRRSHRDRNFGVLAPPHQRRCSSPLREFLLVAFVDSSDQHVAHDATRCSVVGGTVFLTGCFESAIAQYSEMVQRSHQPVGARYCAPVLASQ